jgi:regulator of sigma E protease
MFSIVGAILAIGLLIVVHEAGHYFVARWCKMRVDRFSIGFGPPILSWKRGETDFTIGPIPFGGFVQINGMTMVDEVDPDDERQYPNRPVWQRFVTIFAGPATNYLPAIFFAIILFSVAGVTTGTSWYQVDSFAEVNNVAGKLEKGDRFVKLNGNPFYNSYAGEAGPSLHGLVQNAKGAELDFTVLRDGKEIEVSVTPVPSQSKLVVVDGFIDTAEKAGGLQVGDRIAGVGGTLLYHTKDGKESKSLSDYVQESEGEALKLSVFSEGSLIPKLLSVKPTKISNAGEAPSYSLGIRVGTQQEYLMGIVPSAYRERVDVGVISALGHAFRYPVLQTQAIGKGLFDIVTGRQKGEFAGPVGIATMAKKQFDTGWIEVFLFLMMLNVYLGLFNLLPLPALDGGRLVFLVYEMTTRRRANPKIEATVHMVGIMALLLVMVLVTYKDIAKLF